jgi:voltage-gated sodium channel
VEIALKLFAFRSRFFHQGWNWFDLIIVGIALVPASGPMAVLRALRVLRVLRLFSVVPQLRVVVEALVRAMPGMASVIVVMSLVFYVAAVAATKLFGAAFPDWFGSLGRSMYSLFQVMTLESWSMGIVRPVMETYPFAWIFFVPFIIITSFAVLNLFIALLVNSMNSQHDADMQKDQETLRAAAQASTESILNEIRALRAEVDKLRNNGTS